MLKQSQISEINLLEDGDISYLWKEARLAKITSSQVWKLCSPKGFGETGMGYIRSRVFEKIAKVSSEKEFTTQDTINGLVEEGHALKIFKQRHNLGNNFRVQILINGIDESYGCTPDGIWLKNTVLKDNEVYYEAYTVETKCFSPERHLKCAECLTAAEIKEVDSATYYQKIDQLINCGALTGYLVYFHPAMKAERGGYREIEFKQIDPLIRSDVKFLRERKEKAKQEIERIYQKLTNQ